MRSGEYGSNFFKTHIQPNKADSHRDIVYPIRFYFYRELYFLVGLDRTLCLNVLFLLVYPRDWDTYILHFIERSFHFKFEFDKNDHFILIVFHQPPFVFIRICKSSSSYISLFLFQYEILFMYIINYWKSKLLLY